MAYSFIFLSLLCLSGFIYCQECPTGTSQIKYCNDSGMPPIGDKRVFNIDEDDRSNAGWLICPLYSEMIDEWSVTMYTSDNMAIPNGQFCSFESYDQSQMCMYSNGTLRVFPSFLPSNNSQLLLEYTSPTLNTTVNANYAPQGVYILEGGDAPIQSMEGSPLGISFIIFSTGSSPTVSVTHNGVPFNTNSTRLSIFNDLRCIPPESSSDNTLVRIVQLNPVSVADEGVYVVHVTGDAGTYSASAIVQVSGVGSVAVSPTTSVMVSATPTGEVSSTSVATPTPSTSVGGSQGEGLSDNIVWLIVGVGVFFVVAIVIVLVIIVVMCCCLCSKRPSSSPYQPRGMGVAPEDSKPSLAAGGTSKPRLGSFSSERPLAKSDSNPTMNTTTSDVNYTAVYCTSQYQHCGELLQQKHGDRVKTLTHWEDVRLALLQPSCTDILLFVCPSDEVFTELMSCGVDPPQPYKRNKLRIIMFTPVDHFQSNTLGVNGYRVVLVEGPPDDMNTILTAVNKAELPELFNYSQRSSTTDKEAETMELERERNELLRGILDVHKNSLGIQGQSLDVHRDQLEVTREVNEREEIRMVNEATPTSNETSI